MHQPDICNWIVNDGHPYRSGRRVAGTVAFWLEVVSLLLCLAAWAVSVFVLRPAGGSLRTSGVEATGTFGVPIAYSFLAAALLLRRTRFGWWWCVVGNLGWLAVLVSYIDVVSFPASLAAGVAGCGFLLSVPLLLLLPSSRREFGISL